MAEDKRITFTLGSVFKGEAFKQADKAMESTGKAAKKVSGAFGSAMNEAEKLNGSLGKLAGGFNAVVQGFSQLGLIGGIVAGFKFAMDSVIDNMKKSLDVAEKAAAASANRMRGIVNRTVQLMSKDVDDAFKKIDEQNKASTQAKFDQQQRSVRQASQSSLDQQIGIDQIEQLRIQKQNAMLQQQSEADKALTAASYDLKIAEQRRAQQISVSEAAEREATAKLNDSKSNLASTNNAVAEAQRALELATQNESRIKDAYGKDIKRQAQIDEAIMQGKEVGSLEVVDQSKINAYNDVVKKRQEAEKRYQDALNARTAAETAVAADEANSRKVRSQQETLRQKAESDYLAAEKANADAIENKNNLMREYEQAVATKNEQTDRLAYYQNVQMQAESDFNEAVNDLSKAASNLDKASTKLEDATEGIQQSQEAQSNLNKGTSMMTNFGGQLRKFQRDENGNLISRSEMQAAQRGNERLARNAENDMKVAQSGLDRDRARAAELEKEILSGRHDERAQAKLEKQLREANERIKANPANQERLKKEKEAAERQKKIADDDVKEKQKAVDKAKDNLDKANKNLNDQQKIAQNVNDIYDLLKNKLGLK